MNPLYVLIPTTLCTSFSFLLPVSNPSNAIVFTYGHIHVMDMVGLHTAMAVVFKRLGMRVVLHHHRRTTSLCVSLRSVLQVKAGLGVNVIGVLAVLLAVGTWGVPLFSLDTYPDWAPVLPGFNSTAPWWWFSSMWDLVQKAPKSILFKDWYSLNELTVLY